MIVVGTREERGLTPNKSAHKTTGDMTTGEHNMARIQVPARPDNVQLRPLGGKADYRSKHATHPDTHRRIGDQTK